MTGGASAKRFRHLARSIGGLLWYVVSRQYLSLISAAVLIAALVLVVTSDSFEGKDRNTAQAFEAGPAPTPTPPQQRPSVLFFVVEDEQQRKEIAEAFSSDRFARQNGPMIVDQVVYLIAGTTEEEAQAIARLNFEEWAAQQSGTDMLVVDVRGRFDDR